MHIHIDRIFTTVARNLGLNDFTTYTDSWIEWAYEAERLIGSKDTFVQKECTFTSSGAKATGSITFSDNPTSGDSIILNGATLYFKYGSETSSQNIGAALPANEIRLSTTGLADTMSNPDQVSSSALGLIENLGLSQSDYVIPRNHQKNASILAYPEALNIATYSLSFTSSGTDLITNGDFSTSGSWSGTNESIASGVGTVTTPANNSNSNIQQSISYTSGTDYVLTFKAKASTTSGQIRIQDGSSGDNGGLRRSQTLTNLSTDWVDYSFGFTANDNSDKIKFNRESNVGIEWTFDIDDVVIKPMATTKLNITARDIGCEGNSYTLNSDNANADVSGLSLTGGKGIYRNQQIVLPEDMIKLLGVRVGADDSTYEHLELRKTSAIHRERVGRNTDNTQQRAYRYYVDGNRLNIQHDDMDEITIVYLAYPTDLRGWPMIKEGHETAVAQYIMWQMKLIDYYNAKVPQYIIKDLEKRWYYLCGKVRGDDSMPTSEELKQIGSMWNTLIPLKTSRGLIDF